MELFALVLIIALPILFISIIYIALSCFIECIVENTITVDDEIINEILTRTEN